MMKRILFFIAVCCSAPLLAQSAVYHSSAPTLNNNERTDLRVDTNGNLLIASTTVADNVTDAGTTTKVGGLAQGTSAWPTYTTGTRAPVTLGLRGSLRIEEHVPGGGAVYNSFNNPTDAIANIGWFRASLGMGLVFNGTTWDRQKGDTNGTVMQPALSSTFWNYAAAASGIVNTTTAVTVKSAAGAGVRNYICSINFGHDTLGAATELAIRDGAAGTVLWRQKLQTAAREGDSEVTFSPCLKGTANTLTEVVTLTASVSGGVYVNISGYTGT